MTCFIVSMTLAIIVSILQRTARTLAEKLKLSVLNALLWVAQHYLQLSIYDTEK